MIHLIWSLINGIVVLYFLYLVIGFAVKGKRIFKPPFKVRAIFVGVIGVVQILSSASSEKTVNQIIITDDYNKENNSVVKDVVLEDNLTFDINMIVKYSVDQNEYIPIESSSFLTGLVSGYVWEFKSIDTNAYPSNEKAKFIAKGILKWTLFGITVYSEPKAFDGEIQ